VPKTTQSGLTDNAIGAIAYITFVPALCFLILPRYNARPYVRFHAWQSLLINLIAFLVTFVLTFLAVPALVFGAYSPLWLYGLIWTVWLLLWVFCAVSALNGKSLKLPILGGLAEKEANPAR
jgi:uncharacterized membrane protein